jgi:large conductance mechanosensitive channel
MLTEFKAFVLRGNVLDLAIAVIIGAAFGKIVTSLTDDIIMPLIGALTGGLDFSSHFVRLGTIPPGYAGSLSDYAALKKAGVALLGYGQFLTALINFLIVAFVIFILVKAANHTLRINAGAPAGPTPTEVLLTQIRDELKARPLG